VLLRYAQVFSDNLRKPKKTQEKLVKSFWLVNTYMKKEDIKQFVESVAEIKLLQPSRDTSKDNNEINEVVYDGEKIEINNKHNPTLGYKFLKLKDNSKLCEMGCNKIVTNQIIEKRLAFTPERHWKTYCRTCQTYLHPDKKTLVKGSHAIQSIYLAYFNERNK
jgi:hypothetical protein